MEIKPKNNLQRQFTPLKKTKKKIAKEIVTMLIELKSDLKELKNI